MTKIVIRLMIVATAIWTAACAGGTSSSTSSPAAPSSSAGVSGQLTRSSASASSSTASAASITKAEKDDQSELEGVITKTDPTGPSIVVGGTTVMVPTSTVIRNGQTVLTFADLKVGDRVHVRGTRNGTTFVATQITLQNDEENDDDNFARTGTVAGLTGTCPAVTFTIGTTKVTTTAATRFTDGACAELANGATARVRGTMQADGSIAATSVSFEDNDVEGARVSGVVSGLTGTCPALTFLVGTTSVSTDASTRFPRQGACSQIANGVRVKVRGTKQANGSIQATSVSIATESDD